MNLLKKKKKKKDFSPNTVWSESQLPYLVLRESSVSRWIVLSFCQNFTRATNTELYYSGGQQFFSLIVIFGDAHAQNEGAVYGSEL